MTTEVKICGVCDLETLKFIVEHPYPPKFIGFITNYKKSKRYIEFEKLKKLVNINKKGINFVSVLVNPNNDILEKLSKLNFDYYQLYDVTANETKLIKEKYKKKIISALAIKNKKTFNLNNYGNHERDFTYIDDAIFILDKHLYEFKEPDSF